MPVAPNRRKPTAPVTAAESAEREEWREEVERIMKGEQWLKGLEQFVKRRKWLREVDQMIEGEEQRRGQEAQRRRDDPAAAILSDLSRALGVAVDPWNDDAEVRIAAVWGHLRRLAEEAGDEEAIADVERGWGKWMFLVWDRLNARSGLPHLRPRPARGGASCARGRGRPLTAVNSR